MGALLQAVQYHDAWPGAWLWLVLFAAVLLLVWALLARTHGPFAGRGHQRPGGSAKGSRRGEVVPIARARVRKARR